MNRRLLIRTDKTLFTRDECPVELPTFGAMFAGYLLGIDYWADTSFGPTKDASGRGRDLTLVGEMGAKAIIAPTNYAVLPFTANQLCATNGSCTIIAVAQVAPDVGAHIVGDYQSVATRFVTLFCGGTYAATAQLRSPSGLTAINDPDSDSTRAGFEFIAATYARDRVTVSRSRAGAGLRAPFATTAEGVDVVGGELPIQIGKGINGPAGAAAVAAAFFFDRALTAAELATFMPRLTLLLAGGGTAIAQ